jgi:mannose-6-phosphate isomerase-like protein (cupin superfamily)
MSDGGMSALGMTKDGLRTPRRVVTGLDAEGRSTVLIDGAVPYPGDYRVGMVWRTPGLPADNSGAADMADRPYDFDLMHAGGSIFVVLDYAPGMGCDAPYWHATDTIDYLVVLEGEVVLTLEEGEVTCGPGTFIIDRGVNHAWRNQGSVPARMAAVILPSHPVGNGRTV